MDNISTQLADLAISRSLVLIRLQNGLSKQVAEHYTAMIDDIQTTILKSGNISNRLRQTIKDIKEQLSVPNFDKDLKELAQSEVNYTQKAYNSVIGIDLFKNIPPEGAMSAILNTSLIEGALLSDWFKDLKNSQAFDVERAIKLGVTLGETNYQIAQRLKSTLEISQRNAETLVITSASAIGNQARMEFFNENSEVLKGWVYNAVLDTRTSAFCRAYDNLKWDMNKKPIGHNLPFRQPPNQTHWRCRSTILPWLKSWQELGIDEDEVPVGTRSSLDGYAPQDISFNDWLKRQSKERIEETLGKGRAELFLKGKITMRDLISQQGKTLSIAELKEKYS